MAGERHGRGMGAEWEQNAICESALREIRWTETLSLCTATKFYLENLKM